MAEEDTLRALRDVRRFARTRDGARRVLEVLRRRYRPTAYPQAIATQTMNLAAEAEAEAEAEAATDTTAFFTGAAYRASPLEFTTVRWDTFARLSTIWGTTANVLSERERRRQKAAEKRYQRQQNQAYRRARKLLVSYLDWHQKRQYNRSGTFFVTGSAGGKYLLRQGGPERLFNVVDGKDGLETDGYQCVAPDGVQPEPDILLTLLLWLQTDEPTLLEVANRFPHQMPLDWMTRKNPGWEQYFLYQV